MEKGSDLRKLRGELELQTAEIERRRNYLEELGFSDEWIKQLEESRPSLYTPEAIDAKLTGLKE